MQDCIFVQHITTITLSLRQVCSQASQLLAPAAFLKQPVPIQKDVGGSVVVKGNPVVELEVVYDSSLIGLVSNK